MDSLSTDSEVQSHLFKSLIGKQLIGIRYYCDDPDISEVQHCAKEYVDADNFLVMVFSDGQELSFYANGWPVIVSKGDAMAVDSFRILEEICEALSIRFETLTLKIGQISLFYCPRSQDFLGIGIKENLEDKNFSLVLSFAEDAICEDKDVDEAMLSYLLNTDEVEGLAYCEIKLT